MNKKQWNVLGIFFILMGILFILLDTTSLPCLAGEVTASTIYCVVNAEILEPFIWLFYPLGIVCFILGWLEKRK